jgi:hypothetical protein
VSRPPHPGRQWPPAGRQQAARRASRAPGKPRAGQAPRRRAHQEAPLRPRVRAPHCTKSCGNAGRDLEEGGSRAYGLPASARLLPPPSRAGARTRPPGAARAHTHLHRHRAAAGANPEAAGLETAATSARPWRQPSQQSFGRCASGSARPSHTCAPRRTLLRPAAGGRSRPPLPPWHPFLFSRVLSVYVCFVLKPQWHRRPLARRPAGAGCRRRRRPRDPPSRGAPPRAGGCVLGSVECLELAALVMLSFGGMQCLRTAAARSQRARRPTETNVRPRPGFSSSPLAPRAARPKPRRRTPPNRCPRLPSRPPRPFLHASRPGRVLSCARSSSRTLKESPELLAPQSTAFGKPTRPPLLPSAACAARRAALKHGGNRQTVDATCRIGSNVHRGTQTRVNGAAPSIPPAPGCRSSAIGDPVHLESRAGPAETGRASSVAEGAQRRRTWRLRRGRSGTPIARPFFCSRNTIFARLYTQCSET